MSSSVPPRFLDLYRASNRPNGDFINVMGVVTEFLPPRKSRGSDWTCTFSLSDITLGMIGVMGDEGLKVRYFSLDVAALPSIQGTGDVVVLRDVENVQAPGPDHSHVKQEQQVVRHPGYVYTDNLSSKRGSEFKE